MKSAADGAESVKVGPGELPGPAGGVGVPLRCCMKEESRRAGRYRFGPGGSRSSIPREGRRLLLNYGTGGGIWCLDLNTINQS